MNPIAAFLTGIGTGGLTCLAVQGGLLIGLLAQRKENSESTGWRRLVLPVSGFLAAKIIVYTLFGFILGWVGESLTFSVTVQAWMQGVAAVFIIITGIKIIWPHWLPWLSITAPVGIRRYIRKHAKSEALIAPMILGALTIFIPCGTTVAMETAALSIGSPFQAAAIMFAFTLGTAPLFFVVGVLARGTTQLQHKLNTAVALVVIAIGLYSFNSMLNLIDSSYSFKNRLAYWRSQMGQSAETTQKAELNPVIHVSGNGYDPDTVTVPAGQRVLINFQAGSPLGCTSVVQIPKLRIQQLLKPNTTTKVAAVFPGPGDYTFTCGMGMYSGTITAI